MYNPYITKPISSHILKTTHLNFVTTSPIIIAIPQILKHLTPIFYLHFSIEYHGHILLTPEILSENPLYIYRTFYISQA